MNYYVDKSVIWIKVALMNWNAEDKKNSMLTIREFFLSAIKIL